MGCLVQARGHTISLPTTVFVLRLLGAVASSVAFGLIAAATWSPWNFWLAVGLGFIFGTAFVMGTGYRILIAVARNELVAAPASWSGASAGACIAAFAMWLVAVVGGGDGAFILLALGVAINIAYLPVKAACRLKDCCGAVVALGGVDLRLAEILATALVLGLAGATVYAGSTSMAAIIAIAGHLLVRLASRRLRGRWSWGWPPLGQPGAELAPLAVTLVVALLPL